MASIATDSKGNRSIQFFDQYRKRKTLRLGSMPMRNVEEVKRRVESLVYARIANTAPNDDTARWLNGIDVSLAKKLAAVGLTGPRAEAGTLGDFTRGYIDMRTDLAPNTRKCLEQARGRLVGFFGADKPIRDITEADAHAFAFKMRTDYSEATAARAIKHGRQYFSHALRGRLVGSNPFVGVKAGSMENRERMHYVSREDAAKLLEFAPNAEWRAIIALARYGGLRTPSETLALTWDAVLWDQNKVRIGSPKTGERYIPIFAELAPYLQEAWDGAEPGAVYVVNKSRNPGVNWRTQFQKIIRRAGLVPWERLFQNLRSSREQDLTHLFPLPIVVEWLGNSLEVASKHYLKATDDDYRRAAKSAAPALQKPMHSVAVSSHQTLAEVTETQSV